MKAAPDVVAIAREVGFARIAVVPIEAPRRHAVFESWLAEGKAGEMHYLATTPVILDDTKLQRHLGKLNKTRYNEGIRQTFEWYRSVRAARPA